MKMNRNLHRDRTVFCNTLCWWWTNIHQFDSCSPSEPDYRLSAFLSGAITLQATLTCAATATVHRNIKVSLTRELTVLCPARTFRGALMWALRMGSRQQRDEIQLGSTTWGKLKPFQTPGPRVDGYPKPSQTLCPRVDGRPKPFQTLGLGADGYPKPFQTPGPTCRWIP